MSEQYLTVAQAAQFLGCPVATLYNRRRARHEGDAPLAFKLAGKLRYPMSKLVEWTNSRLEAQPEHRKYERRK